MIEDTLVVLKPDALSRGLVGNIFDRLEKAGLKMVACKMARADEKTLDQMYDTSNREWVEGMGEKTLSTLKEFELDPVKELGTDDPYKIGLQVANQLREYMMIGPVIVTVWEGFKAVTAVRKIRGNTRPLFAETGTIAGDFSHASPLSSMMQGKAVQNLVHASGTVDEANKEIEVWFGKDFQPAEYDRTDSIFF